jgi:hypothetical protein
MEKLMLKVYPIATAMLAVVLPVLLPVFEDSIALRAIASTSTSQTTPSPVVQPFAQAAPHNFIGLRYRELPIGVESVAGWMLNLSPPPEYAVARVRQGSQEMLWLEVLIDRDASGVPLFEVIDVLALPKLAEDETVASSIPYYCTQEGKDTEFNVELVAIVVYEPEKEYWSQIRRVWRANRQSGKFEEIGTEGIVCINPGFGV